MFPVPTVLDRRASEALNIGRTECLSIHRTIRGSFDYSSLDSKKIWVKCAFELPKFILHVKEWTYSNSERR